MTDKRSFDRWRGKCVRDAKQPAIEPIARFLKGSSSTTLKLWDDPCICLWNGLSGSKGKRINLLTSNRRKMMFLLCTLRLVGQEIFYEADEILTNVVNNPLRLNPHWSSSSSLPCGKKCSSWHKNMKYESTAGNVHVPKQWLIRSSSPLFKTWIKRKKKALLWLRDFYQHWSTGAGKIWGMAGVMMTLWSISRLISWTVLNVILSRTCIAFVWGYKLLFFPLFPALITVFCRGLNFKIHVELIKIAE